MARTTKLALWVVCLVAIGTGLFVSFDALHASRQLAWVGQQPIYPVRFEIPPSSSESWTPSVETPEAEDASLAEVEEIAPRETPAAPAAAPKPHFILGMIPVNFRLGGSAGRAPASSDKLIPLSMPVVYNSGSIGAVPIWIDPGGAITMDSGKLSQALSEANAPLSEAIANSGQERVSFSSLRSRGMTINYDPIGNRIVMSYRS